MEKRISQLGPMPVELLSENFNNVFYESTTKSVFESAMMSSVEFDDPPPNSQWEPAGKFHPLCCHVRTMYGTYGNSFDEIKQEIVAITNMKCNDSKLLRRAIRLFVLERNGSSSSNLWTTVSWCASILQTCGFRTGPETLVIWQHVLLRLLAV